MRSSYRHTAPVTASAHRRSHPEGAYRGPMALDDDHARPPGTSDATVAALGKLSEALEVVEEARGHLYAFHRRCGTADLTLQDAVARLRDCGQEDLAAAIETDLVGRNIVAGRWSFQVVEEYDDGYYARFREHERRAREQLMAGRRHVFEAEMKEAERTPGRAGHAATPREASGA